MKATFCELLLPVSARLPVPEVAGGTDGVPVGATVLVGTLALGDGEDVSLTLGLGVPVVSVAVGVGVPVVSVAVGVGVVSVAVGVGVVSVGVGVGVPWHSWPPFQAVIRSVGVAESG